MTNGLFTSNKTVLIFSKTMVSTFYLFINNINARTKMFYKKCQFFILLPLITQICQVKFIYSEKATKFYEIFPLLLTVCTVVKSKAKISQNFVVFSEYMNFTSFEMGLLVEIGYCSCESFIQKEKLSRIWINSVRGSQTAFHSCMKMISICLHNLTTYGPPHAQLACLAQDMYVIFNSEATKLKAKFIQENPNSKSSSRNISIFQPVTKYSKH